MALRYTLTMCKHCRHEVCECDTIICGWCRGTGWQGDNYTSPACTACNGYGTRP